MTMCTALLAFLVTLEPLCIKKALVVAKSSQKAYGSGFGVFFFYGVVILPDDYWCDFLNAYQGIPCTYQT